MHANLRNMRPLYLLAAGLLAVGLVSAADAPDSTCRRLAASIAGASEPAAMEQVESARRRIVDEPESAEARGRLGMVAHAYESFHAALACYDEAVELGPQQLRWRYYRARVLAWFGRHNLALSELDWLLHRRSDDVPSLQLKAELLMRAGDLDGSRQAAEALLELDPQSSQANYGLGQVFVAQGLPRQAAKAFESALASTPHYAQARYALALAYRRIGRDEEAKQQLAIHQRLGQAPPPRAPDPLMDEVEALYRGVRAEIAAGSIAARAGDSDAAIAHFNSALAVNPRLPVAHSNLVLLYGQTQRLDEAKRHYLQAIAISPNWVEAHSNWGGVLLQAGRLEPAAKVLAKAVAAGPHHSQARVQLGLALDQLDRPAEAAVQYRLALDSDPLHPNAHYLLGRSLLNAGRLEEGLDELEKAVEVGDGRTAAYLEALVRVHEADGRIELALGYARRALRRANADGTKELESPLREAIERLEARLEAER